MSSFISSPPCSPNRSPTSSAPPPPPPSPLQTLSGSPPTPLSSAPLSLEAVRTGPSLEDALSEGCVLLAALGASGGSRDASAVPSPWSSADRSCMLPYCERLKCPGSRNDWMSSSVSVESAAAAATDTSVDALLQRRGGGGGMAAVAAGRGTRRLEPRGEGMVPPATVAGGWTPTAGDGPDVRVIIVSTVSRGDECGSVPGRSCSIVRPPHVLHAAGPGHAGDDRGSVLGRSTQGERRAEARSESPKLPILSSGTGGGGISSVVAECEGVDPRPTAPLPPPLMRPLPSLPLPPSSPLPTLPTLQLVTPVPPAPPLHLLVPAVGALPPAALHPGW